MNVNLELEALRTVGEWITRDAPDDAIPEDPMAAIAAMRLVEEELAVEGIPERNLATFVTTWMEPEARVGDRREPPPQLHRPRRVPDDLRDPAALHPHAGRALQCARRDDRDQHSGLVRGDHARGAVAEVEVAQATRGRQQADRQAEPRLRRRRARRLGEVLPLLRRRAADRAPAGRQVHGRPRGHRAAHRREHDRRRGRRRHHLHRPRRRRGRDQRPAARAEGQEGARRPAAHRRRQRRLRLAVPLSGLEVGLPA